MEKIIEICEIAGFKITETRHFEDGKLKTIYHIRNGNGKIVSREYCNLVEPSKILADLRDSATRLVPTGPYASKAKKFMTP